MKRLSVIFVLTLCGSVLAYPGKLQSVFLSEANKLLDSNEWLKIQKLIDEGFCDKAYKEMGFKTELDIFDACRDSWNWQKKNPNGYDK